MAYFYEIGLLPQNIDTATTAATTATTKNNNKLNHDARMERKVEWWIDR